MSDATLSLLVLAGCVGLFIWNRLSVGVVAILTALALYATGLVTATEAVAGFGDPVVVFIASLFVLSEGLESSGVTAWAGQQLITRAGTARNRLLIALMGLSAVMAALVTPNGAAAALLPVVVLASRRSKQSTSQMLMPLAFAASAGALLVLSGSTVNVIVSDALFEATGERFGFFEFGLIGLPLVLVDHRGLGPRRPPAPARPVADVAARRLLRARRHPGRALQPRRGLLPARGPAGVRRRRQPARAGRGARRRGAHRGAAVHRVRRPARTTSLGVGDVVVVTGESDGITSLVDRHGFAVATTPLTRGTREALLGREVGVAELVVRPRSRVIGEVVFAGLVRSGVTVLGVRRLGKDRGGDHLALAEGDSLLVHGPWPYVEAFAADDDVLIVDSPELVRRQTVALGPKAWRAIAVLVGTVALLATGVVPPAIAGLDRRDRDGDDRGRRRPAGLPGGLLADRRARRRAHPAVGRDRLVRRRGPGGRLAGRHRRRRQPAGGPRRDLRAHRRCSVRWSATPRPCSSSRPSRWPWRNESGVALAPVLMLVAVAGAASFLTPIATPANMMVMGAGGYRFSDYWKLGLATTLAWFVVAVLLIPVIWPT